MGVQPPEAMGRLISKSAYRYDPKCKNCSYIAIFHYIQIASQLPGSSCCGKRLPLVMPIVHITKPQSLAICFRGDLHILVIKYIASYVHI